MTRNDESFFFQYREHQQRELALAAIDHRVSMGMIESLMGRKQALRGMTAWNVFQTKNSEVFKGKAMGVKNSGGMAKLSSMWNSLTPEERASYDPANHTQPAEEATEDIADESAPPDLATVSGLRAHSKSLEVAERRVGKWMDEWNKKAVHIAATNHCELVMFAVSNHLSRNNFQLSRATPGAAEFVKQMYEADGLKNYQSRLQAFATGAKINSINPAITQKGKAWKTLSPVQDARSKLAELVESETAGKKTEWSWQGCDIGLAKLGYKVVFLPGTSTRPEWIKSPSSRLQRPQANLIVEDITNGLIRVVKDRDALIGSSGSRQPPSPVDPVPNNSEHAEQQQESINTHTKPAPRKRKNTTQSRTTPKKKRRVQRDASLTISEQAPDSTTNELSQEEDNNQSSIEDDG